MAERITPAEVTFRRPGAPQKYPWEDWTDGSMWHLLQGIDYQTSTKGFRAVVHQAAQRYGLKVHTRETDRGLVVTFSAGNRVRHFLPDTALGLVVALSQSDINEDPSRIHGLTEMQLIPVERKAIA
ncbi:hypothetical protein [Streptomyces sp. VNUA74]|uniref:hypothetical protein n=1 Tax=Streptomyces sp. VNUA74 TaxID=3062685 RepID=UPI00280BB9A8|nr:hypothetical protein [Streptomyces sp. VNUA74]WML79165.1 hypothetical protein Q3101_04630 [Streptomyces sp. VNUA74]